MVPKGLSNNPLFKIIWLRCRERRAQQLGDGGVAVGGGTGEGGGAVVGHHAWRGTASDQLPHHL